MSMEVPQQFSSPLLRSSVAFVAISARPLQLSDRSHPGDRSIVSPLSLPRICSVLFISVGFRRRLRSFHRSLSP